jgi:glycosyltransferase involved in cell wall biosynthesis
VSERTLKIVLLSHAYPPFIFGGIGAFVKDLAIGLSKMSVDVTVISGFPVLRSTKKGFRETENGVTIIRLPYPAVPPHHSFFQLANFKKLSLLTDEERPDVIHGQSYCSYPAILRLKKAAPFLVTFHASPLMEKITSTRAILRGGSLTDFRTYVLGYPVSSLLCKKELQESELSVAVSSTLRSDLLMEMGQKYASKIRAVHNGVNLESLDQDYETAGNGEKESEKTIIFMGRLFWRKGALNIVKMAYYLQKEKSGFKIIVHGHGPLFGKMQSEIISLGLRNIELKGFTTRAELLSSLRMSKYVALPSLYDACPIAIIEGMCLGKIPLMLSLPFGLEITKGGRYGVIARDIRSLVNKLLSYKNTRDLNSFGKEIKAFARTEYDSRKTASEYLKLYHEICT